MKTIDKVKEELCVAIRQMSVEELCSGDLICTDELEKLAPTYYLSCQKCHEIYGDCTSDMFAHEDCKLRFVEYMNQAAK
jgi:dissimilatory sulfite reductase (desulfoviridin) alpha/beta subunit